MNKIPMTILGEKKLKEELQRLKSIERPRIITAISEARSHGDLKENAEYHAAREQQSFIEGRILEIEGKLSLAQVIDVTQMENSGKVIFGTTVSVVNVDTQEAITYKIVGEDEANIQEKKISVTSPIARSFIGKHVGDEVEAVTPQGKAYYEIVDVQYI